MKKLAIITTHPIQYYAPLFKMLASRGGVQIKVFYTWGQSKESVFDPTFGHVRTWDIPLLEGYEYEFIENIAKNKPGSSHFMGIVCPTLVGKIKQYDPSAILVIGWAFHAHLKLLWTLKGKTQILFRGDSTLLDELPGLKTSLRRIFLTLIYSRVDAAFYVGSNSKQYFLKHGLKEKQLFFAPHAIDNKRFSEKKQEVAFETRKELGIPENALVFLFAGKFEPKKNPLFLIKAFLSINQKSAYLILIGSGELEGEIDEQIRNKERIKKLPFQNQSKMPAMYQMCDVFCLPSKGPNETWGLAVNEAMATGRAVLVSDKVGCAVDLVSEGVNGFVFQHNSIDSLQEKMEKFVEIGRDGAIEMGVHSKKLIEAWSFENQCLAFENYLSS